MRIGLVHPVAAAPGAGPAVAADAAAAEDAGLDLLWLDGTAGGHAIVAAAFVAAGTSVLRLAACVPAGAHPVHLAEQASVADHASNGRLILALHAGDPALLAESAAVVLAAAAGRPFRHDGARWTIPARGADGHQGLISVTPPPVQPELPLWLAGDAATQAGRTLGLSHVAGSRDDEADAGRAWRETAAALGGPVVRLRRPAVRMLTATADGDFDDDELAATLAQEHRAWGLDVALLALPPQLGAPARAGAVRRLGACVRPRLQMELVPPDVTAGWAVPPATP